MRGLARARGGEAAFTLLEIMAVVAILALLSAFILPNLGAVRARALGREAERLADQLEFARQRSIVLGVPHRVVIDIDRASYHVEWIGGVSRDEDTAPPPPSIDDMLASGLPLDLGAPTQVAREYQPLPGRFGRPTVLDPALEFSGVQTPGGWVNRGETYIGFERDGTADYAEIVVDDESGRSIVLEVLPLAETVRIRDEPI